MTPDRTSQGLACVGAIAAALAALAIACGGEDDAGPMPISRDDPACRYELSDISAGGPDMESKEFPPGLYPSEYRELGSGLSITLIDPLDEARELTLTVPQCLKEEALAVIEARQEANEEQEAEGIPFEQRIFE